VRYWPFAFYLITKRNTQKIVNVDAKKDKIITITMVTGDIKSYIKYYRNDKLIKL